VVGRFGGEEFMIIGPISDYKSALYLGERIRTAVEKEVFSHENTDFNITISIGISVWNSSIASEKDLVKFADEALYTAKRSGRNQVRMYEGV
jgi:diguanylate cyclase (GGDEF)-like protein